MGERFRRGGIEVGLLTTDDERGALENLFGRVAEEHGWKPGGDLDARLGRSTRIAAWVDGRLAGGVELCAPEGGGRLPLQATWPEIALLDSSRPAELVLIALALECRATPGLLWALCAEAWRICADAGVTDLLAAATPRNLRIYRRLGWCPEPVGSLREHWGEPCLPCRVGIAAVAEEFGRRAERSPGHALAVRVARRR